MDITDEKRAEIKAAKEGKRARARQIRESRLAARMQETGTTTEATSAGPSNQQSAPPPPSSSFSFSIPPPFSSRPALPGPASQRSIVDQMATGTSSELGPCATTTTVAAANDADDDTTMSAVARGKRPAAASEEDTTPSFSLPVRHPSSPSPSLSDSSLAQPDTTATATNSHKRTSKRRHHTNRPNKQQRLEKNARRAMREMGDELSLVTWENMDVDCGGLDVDDDWLADLSGDEGEGYVPGDPGFLEWYDDGMDALEDLYDEAEEEIAELVKEAEEEEEEEEEIEKEEDKADEDVDMDVDMEMDEDDDDDEEDEEDEEHDYALIDQVLKARQASS